MVLYIIIAIVIVIIVIIVAIVAIVNNKNNSIVSSNKYPAVLPTNNHLSIVLSTTSTKTTENIQQLRDYCNKWRYELSAGTDNSFTLVLHNIDKLNIREDQCLDFFITLLCNVEYIAFYGTDNYFTRGKYRWQTIKQQITPTLSTALGDLNDDAVRNILAHGYPHSTGNGIILSRAYLDLVLYGKPMPFVLPCLLPSVTPARSIKTINISKIPKIIHQTFETALLPTALKTAVDTWIDLNPDYEHRYFSDRDRRNFIQQHFDSKVLQAYDKLIPGSYRADLWRYCVIYQNGGVYVDIKLGALVPLSKIIIDDASMVVVNDDLPGSMFTSFFAAIPKHPALLQCINVAVQRVLAEEYGSYMVYPTGPLAMGAAMLPMYGFQDHMTNGRQQDLLVYSHYREDNNIYVKNSVGERLIKFRYVTNFTEQNVHDITGRPHYKVNWKEHTAYRQ